MLQTEKQPTPALSVSADAKPGRNAVQGILAAAGDIALQLQSGSISTDQLKASMGQAFGGSDAAGAWSWKEAYEALEVAQILFLRRYGAAIMAKGPVKAMAMLQRILGGLPTHTRRSEEMVELQQFSTPLPLAFAASIAADPRKGDVLLEPSAGTGLLAIFGELAGAHLVLNDLAETRSGLLRNLFPQAEVFSLNGEQIHDRLPEGLNPSLVVMNPPFSAGANVSRRSTGVTYKHVSAALSRLANGGRLVLITGEGFKPAGKWLDAFTALQERATMVFSAALPATAFAKHGTTFATRLTVFDKIPADNPSSFPGLYHSEITDLASLVRILPEALPARGEAEGVAFLPNRHTAPSKPAVAGQPRSAEVAERSITAAEIEIVLQNWEGTREEASGAAFVPWVPQTFRVKDAKPHVTELCQSAAMASVAPPSPDYRPVLFPRLVEQGILSDAQIETIVYAGRAHSDYLEGFFAVNDDGHTIRAAAEGDEGAVRFRRGFFLGDGTGAGKGRQCAGIFLDNWNQGRRRGIWISGSAALLEDARRDWSALGMDETQIVPLDRFKPSQEIALPEGILFATFATLRSEGRGGSRIEQVMRWCGDGFDGVIAFDEAHSMQNAVAKEGELGKGQASLQGLAGLRLQFGLPEARVVYASATAGSDVTDLAYGERLGLWGSEKMPFNTRTDFISEMHQGGIAAMEMIARDLKALGLYTSRVLSYEGVEVDPLIVDLSPAQVKVYDTYADAFQIIHQNIQDVLQEIGAVNFDGKTDRRAKAAAISIFESTKQRFFNHLLTSMTGPRLIEEIEQDLEAGRAPVLQLVSTSEAVLDRRLAEIPPSDWNDLQVDITPRELVIDYLKTAFPVELYEEYEVNGDTHFRKATDDDGNPVMCRAAVERRERLVEDLASLPAVPSVLDQILHHFGEDRVAEVTGRSRRILEDKGRYYVARRAPSSNLSETQAFLDGKKDILIFSEAGGTGRSYHAGREFKNHRQRVHYLVEPGWKADRAVQGLGRTKRTNQVHEPIFRPISTDVKGQKRFISTIARRLDTLGAITRGQRQGGTEALFRESDNLESDYARGALRTFYFRLYAGELESIGLKEFEERTGLQLTCYEGGLREDLPPIQRFLNRILALPIHLQNAIFEEFDEFHEGAIEYAKMNGSYQLGVAELKADSLVALKREVIYRHETGAETSLVEIERRDRLEITDWREHVDQPGARTVVNAKSKRAGILVPHSGYRDSDGILRKRLRLYRPGGYETMHFEDLEESAWEKADKKHFRLLWEAEAETLPEYKTLGFYMVTGLLLPVWRYLPKHKLKVRRLVLDDGERLLGRIISAVEVQSLYRQLGINNQVEVRPAEAWEQIKSHGTKAELAKGLFLRRSLVAGQYRVEVTGWAPEARDGLKNLGCMTEIIQYRLRIFVPNVKVLEHLLKDAPVISMG